MHLSLVKIAFKRNLLNCDKREERESNYFPPDASRDNPLLEANT